jgi:hypothetical protein
MTQWADIENDDSVAYVKEDTKSYLLSETVPRGIVAVQGTDLLFRFLIPVTSASRFM